MHVTLTAAADDARCLVTATPGEPAVPVLPPPGPRAPEDFDVFYRREYRGLVALAYALSGSRNGAEDLAQEAFLAAHRRWDEVSRYDQPLAWVRRVVANMSASVVRRRVVEARALVRLGGRPPSQVAALEPEDADFWRVVRALPRRQAQATALYYLFDLALIDIAAVMDISEGAVKAHLHKARAAIAERLRSDEEDSS